MAPKINNDVWIVTSFGTGIVFIAILLIFPFADYRDDENKKTINEFLRNCKNCEEAKKMAEADFYKGRLKWFANHSLDEKVESKFPHTFYNEIKKELGINIIYTGCTHHEEYYCYNEMMDTLISKK